MHHGSGHHGGDREGHHRHHLAGHEAEEKDHIKQEKAAVTGAAVNGATLVKHDKGGHVLHRWTCRLHGCDALLAWGVRGDEHTDKKQVRGDGGGLHARGWAACMHARRSQTFPRFHFCSRDFSLDELPSVLPCIDLVLRRADASSLMR